jgi:hypothetical protein
MIPSPDGTAVKLSRPGPKRGFDVRCVLCGDAGRSITLDAHDTASFHCAACDADFTADEVRGIMAGWAALLAWADQAPPLA